MFRRKSATSRCGCCRRTPTTALASAAEVATELTALRATRLRLKPAWTRAPNAFAPRVPAKQPHWMGPPAFAIFSGPAPPAAAYFGGIILVPTPRGTLVIEIDDPNIEVVVKQGGVKLFDPTTKRRTRPGTWATTRSRSRTPRRAGSCSTKKFTITRDGQTKVNIWLDRAVAANPQSNGVNLDPAKIPVEERYPGQPKELVAVLGEHRAYEATFGILIRQFNICFNADGKLLFLGTSRRLSLGSGKPSVPASVA